MSAFELGQVKAVEKAIVDTAFISIYGSNATIVNTHDTAVAATRAALDFADVEQAEALARAKRACKTLGEIVERQIEDTLRWAGMKDQIGTEDPDQQLAWELCAEMPGRIAELEAQVAALLEERAS